MRHLFGLSPADVSVEQVGEDMKLRPGSIGSAWDALAGGTQITDLLDMNSSPITEVTSDTNSVIGFYGPDAITSLYLDFGFANRVLMQATDLGMAIDSLQADKLDLSGGTMTGPLTLSADPSTALGAATKQYADGKLPLSGGTLSGNLTVSGTTQSGTVQGSSASGGNLTLSSTSHATKGKIFIGSSSIVIDEADGSLNLSGDAGYALSVGGQANFDHGIKFADTQYAIDVGTFSGSSWGFSGALTTSGDVAVGGNLSVGGVGKVQYVRKTTDQSRTSTTTLANDSQLVLPVVANATYSLFLLCIFSGGTTGDIKFDWTVPSGTVLRWADQTGASGLNSDVDVYSAPGSTTQVAFQIWATVVTSSTAGNVQLRWAQNATDTNATIVRTNSSLQLTRVA